MKFTQKQILQIIKEEIDAVVNENRHYTPEGVLSMIMDIREVMLHIIQNEDYSDPFEIQQSVEEMDDLSSQVDYIMGDEFLSPYTYEMLDFVDDSVERNFFGQQFANQFYAKANVFLQVLAKAMSIFKKAQPSQPEQPEQPSSDGGISDERYKKVYNAGMKYALSGFDEDVLKAAGIDQDALTPAEEDAFEAGFEEGQEQVQMQGTEYDIS